MEKVKINLRRAEAGDIDDILALEKSLDGTKIYSALTDRKELEEEIKSTIFYVMEKDGKIVGDTAYEMKGENHAYIDGLVVSPEFQGQGIARQAMTMILEELKNIKVIDLVTHPENERAIKLYESIGFKKVGEPIENYYGDGQPRIKMVFSHPLNKKNR
jgi:ribosomal protein S18 acetylase RimI-like enzyme